MRSMILVSLLSLAGLTACLNDDYVSPEEQLELDIAAIDEYLQSHDIVAQEHESGLRYVITEAGDGDSVLYNSKIDVKYVGKFMKTGVVFDSSDSINFQLNELYLGWQIGIPLIREGGAITLYIPRGYTNGSSIMIFDVELLGVE